jgi:hypothetical protein
MTPRTNEIDRAERKRNGEDYFPGKMRDHAQQLERELNTALADLSFRRDLQAIIERERDEIKEQLKSKNHGRDA